MGRTIHEQINHLGHRVNDVALELGYVLKAIEELAVEKGVMTQAEIQNKIIELSERGWQPSSVEVPDDRVQDEGVDESDI